MSLLRDSAETVLPPRSQTTSLKRIVGGAGPPNSRAMRSAFLGRYGVVISVVRLLRAQRLCFVLFSPQLLVSCPHQPFFCSMAHLRCQMVSIYAMGWGCFCRVDSLLLFSCMHLLLSLHQRYLRCIFSGLLSRFHCPGGLLHRTAAIFRQNRNFVQSILELVRKIA